MGESADPATVFAAGDGSGAVFGSSDGSAEGMAGVSRDESSLQGGRTSLVGTPSGMVPHNSSLPVVRRLRSQTTQ